MQPPLEVTQTELNQEIKIDLGEAAIRYEDTIHNAYRKIFGISAWYKSYIVSEDFKRQTPEIKKDSFETYKGLISMFDFMEFKINEFDKSLEDL